MVYTMIVMVYTMVYIYGIYHDIYHLPLWYIPWYIPKVVYTTFGVVYTMRQPSRCEEFESASTDVRLGESLGWLEIIVDRNLRKNNMCGRSAGLPGRRTAGARLLCSYYDP